MLTLLKPEIQNLMNTLKAFIENYESKNGVSQLDSSYAIELYRKRVEDFYSQISNWLKSLSESGKLSITLEEITITEDSLGTYPLNKMIISFGKFHIELRPVGTILIGTPGRIDMVYNGRVQMFILILESIHNAGQITTVTKKDINMKPRFVWKYISDDEQNIYETVDKNSFETLLVKLINA